MKLRRRRNIRAIGTRACGTVAGGRGPQASLGLRWTMAGGALLLTGNLALAAAPAGLPVACTGMGPVCKGLAFDKLGTGSTAAANAAGTLLTVNQKASSAIFNWQSFNIAPGNTVQFVQPSASSVALNRIFDPNLSSISGNLIANGQVYLVNPNGILFGKGARVDVGGLIASTLDVRDSTITSGLLYTNNARQPSQSPPIFSSDPTAIASDLGSATAASPAIVVQQGASIYAAGRDAAGTVVSAGRVFLFAPTVENGGSIQVDGGGQVILASGSDVFLGSSADPSLRGLLVEVAGSSNTGVTVDATGSIQVARGNITLMGLAVNQAGTLTATSALDENGTIRLIAREVNPANLGLQAAPTDPSVLISPSVTGTVTLSSGSKTVVAVDTTDASTLPLNDPTAASLRSKIEIQGGAVQIGGSGTAGSTLVEAHGGDVTVTARAPDSGSPGGGAPAAYVLGDGSLLGANHGAATIDVGADAKIDVSGLQNVLVDGARNFVYIDRLTSNSLANAPYQRTGFLFGKGVYVNLAQAPSWIDVSNLQAALAGTQAERNTVAGTVALRAEGSVHLEKGSVVDVSGGSIAFTAAIGRTSQLITASGAVVDISGASADTQYVGFADQGSITSSDAREGISQTTSWQAPHYTQVGGFVQGQGAGTVEIYAPSGSIDGTLLGATSTGPNQRSTPAPGGTLRIGSHAAGNLDLETEIQRANILLGSDAAALLASLSPAQAADTFVVDTGMLARGGINRLDLTSDGTIELAGSAASTLELGSGGQFVARANAIAINSSIHAPGGTVSLTERSVTGVPANSIRTAWKQRDALAFLDLVPGAARGSVVLAPGTSLDVAGLWTNDALSPAPVVPMAPIVLNGGSIQIQGRYVDVSGGRFDVSSGGTLSQSGVFQGGHAGSLSVTGTYVNDGLGGEPSQSLASLVVDSGVLNLGTDFGARIRGFGVAGGGTLVIGAPALQVGVAAPPPTGTGTPTGAAASVLVDSSFGSEGFQSYRFNAFDLLSVAGPGFAPTALWLRGNSLLSTAVSGNSLLDVVSPQAPLAGQTLPMNISLSASRALDGTVQVEAGSPVAAGVQGTISVIAGSNIEVGGQLLAPAGSVSLALAARSLSDSSFSVDQLNRRAIQLDPGSTIDVSGASLVVQDGRGIRSGQVLDAGSVSINAPMGTVAIDPGASIAARGASDSVDILVLPSAYQRQLVVSAGGAVSILANNGALLEGAVDARGGSPVSPGGSLSVMMQAQGNLVNALSNGSVDPVVGAQLMAPIDLSITSQLPALVPGQGSFAATAGRSVLPLSWVNSANSGFDRVWLQSPDSISFPEAASRIAVRGSLVLSAQSIDAAAGSSVAISAPYVAMGDVARLSSVTVGNLVPYNTPAASGGSASLLVSGAQQIDLVGNLALQGIGTTELDATGDVRTLGVLPGGSGSSVRVYGSLQFAGSLAINAAQVYPATQTSYTFASAGGAADSITIGAPTATALAPLSAGGSIDFQVASFLSSGTVIAPQGSISVEATNIHLAPGSLLSVAGSALVPYGTVLNGNTWTYGVPPGNTDLPIAPYKIGSASGVFLPGKGINLTAASIDAAPGSTLDVAGGGDVQGMGFVAGPGGSYDMSLNFPNAASPGSRNPFFALLPSRGASPAPYDPQTFGDLVLNSALAPGSSAVFQVGETITISAGSAIPAGTYTVLPPRYALLPGAFAVEAAAGYQDMQPGSSLTMPDGSAIVAGRIGFASSGTAASRWSGYRVYTSGEFRTFSEFHDSLGSAFFPTFAAAAGAPPPRVGQDAGLLQVDASSTILLASTIDASPAPAAESQALASSVGASLPTTSARGAALVLDAPSVAVSDAPTLSQSPVLTLDAATLTKLGSESLILGSTIEAPGPVSQAGQVLPLSNPAASVSVSAKSALAAGEVLLAGGSVAVGPGSQIEASASSLPQTMTVLLSGDGAGLYVGNTAANPAWIRSGASAPGTATVGDLAIGAGAAIQGRSVYFDATHSQAYDATFQLQAVNVNLSASVINFGGVPTGTPGLDLTPNLLAQLSGAGAITLSSSGGFDVYGAATLGNLDPAGTPVLRSLTLVGPGVAGFDDPLTAKPASLSIAAGHVRFDNSAGASLANAASSAGTLQVRSIASTAGSDGSIEIAGPVMLAGFDQVALSAVGTSSAPGTAPGSGDLVFTGPVNSSSGLALGNASSSLAIDATRITADRGVNALVTVPGTLVITASGPAATLPSTQLGASLRITAQAIDMGGRIDLPSGAVSLSANGGATGDGITLEPGSSIRVAGSTVSFASTTEDASAGSIELASASGSVAQLAGSVLDLSGAGVAGDAGALGISAPGGAVRLLGTLDLAPGSAARGASVSIDAAHLDNFSELAGAIQAGSAGSSAQSVSMRARSGDIAVGAADSIRARDIVLEADGGAGINDGSVQIAGHLDASGAGAGTILVAANDQIALEAGSQLLARSDAANQVGGSVVLTARVTADSSPRTAGSAISLAPATPSLAAARIDVSALASPADPAFGGTITLRTRALGGSDVDLSPLAASSLVGARQDIIEGVLVDSTGSIPNLATVVTAYAPLLTNYMSAGHRAAMVQRLFAGAAPSALSLRPGLEVQSSGDVTIASAIDFSTGLTGTNAATCTACKYRYSGSTAASDPGDLTVRAAGNINVRANVGDGFVPTTPSALLAAITAPGNPNPTPWTAGESWSLAFTAGADLTAADAGRFLAGAPGSIAVGPATSGNPVTIRTGTGTLSLSAATDITLSSRTDANGNAVSSSVYSAGVASGAVPASVSLPAFLLLVPGKAPLSEPAIVPYLVQDGGNVSIAAGHDVLQAGNGSGQMITDWLLRAGVNSNQSATPWGISWVDFGQFQQGFGALGGGNLSLDAGRDLTAVSAVVASNFINSVETGGQTVVLNAGSLTVQAGDTISQGLFYDQSGAASVSAASIASSANTTRLADLRLAQGSSTLDVQVRESAQVSPSFNPTAFSPSALFGIAKYRSTSSAASIASVNSMFFTYDGVSSLLRVRASAGDIDVMQPAPGPSAKGLISNTGSIFGYAWNSNADVLPPNVTLASFGGSVEGPGSQTYLYLFPSPTGELRVLAGGGISALSGQMSQADPSLMAAIGALQANLALDLPGSVLFLPLAGAVPLHGADSVPAEIVALGGPITYSDLTLPKTSEIAASGNIGPSVTIDIQNSNAQSLSTVSAGGAIDFSVNTGTTYIDHIFVGGPGAAQIVAGGSINLGADGSGIDSRGNLDNPNLPPVGASLIVVAGAGRTSAGLAQAPDYTGAILNFIRYDAFASEGASSVALNQGVLAALGADPALQPLVDALHAAIKDRTSTAALAAQLATMQQSDPAMLATGAVKLATAIQTTNNRLFVQSVNQDTFAPAYAAFMDLFPGVADPAAAIRRFIADNPFSASPQAATLRSQALQGLPPALVNAIDLGIADPAGASQPGSPFSQALAAIDPATLAAGGRQLLANSLAVAGQSTDALRASGGLTGAGSPYAKGLTAFAASFSSTATPGLNDLQMDFNEIKAEQTGSVAVFAPQGTVFVGQSAPPVLDPTASGKQPSQLGLFTYGGGDIIGMVRDNFDVFRSRVFTLAGGDIDIWSSLGNVDAGRGARDVAVVPPPTLVADPTTGIEYLYFGASVTGSGIGALKTEVNQPPSNINLMAPAGYVDAGEAGIRAQTGTVTLGTNLVINAGNIQAASGVSGGAVVAAPPPPVPSSSNNSAGDRAAGEAQREAIAQQQAASRAASDLARLRVIGEFIGFDSDCKDPNNRSADCAAARERGPDEAR